MRGKKNSFLLCKSPLIGKKQLLKKKKKSLRKAFLSRGEAPRALREVGTEQVLLLLRSPRGSGSSKNRQLMHMHPFTGVLEALRSN